MEANFASCLLFTQAEEGGYVDDPRDSGNWTSGYVGQGSLVGSNMGVGAPAMVAWVAPEGPVTAAEMRDLPLSVFEAMGRSRYWQPLGCGMFPGGLDLMLFDFGWNRGIATSLNTLTRYFGISQAGSGPMPPASIVAGLQQVSPTALLQRLSNAGVRILQRLVGVQVDGVAGPVTTAAFEARPDLGVTAIILALSAAQVSSYRLLWNFSLYGAGWLARSSRRQTAALSLAQSMTATET